MKFLKNIFSYISPQRKFKKFIKSFIYLSLLFLFLNLSILATNNVLFFAYKSGFNNKVYNIETLFQKEFLQFLKLSRETVSAPDFIKAVLENDSQVITGIINDIKKEQAVSSVTVIDGDGRIISDMESMENSENYIFQAIKWKDDILDGRIFSSFAVRGSSMIEMVVGQPILSDDKVVGALVINRKVDDEYIKYFKNKYLSDNFDIGVFVQNEGIVETSFDNSEVENIFAANVDIDIQRASDIFLSKSNNSLFLNNQEYFVDKLYLEELNSEEGAILLFYRFSYFSKFFIPSFTSSLFLFLLFLVLLRFKKYSTVGKNKPGIKILFLIFFILFVTIMVLNNILYYGFYHPGVKLKKAYEYKIYNSVLKFDPEYSAIDINSTKKIAVSLLSGGEAINAAKVVINYDPKKVLVEEIITENSFCRAGGSSMFIEKDIDNNKGRVSIVCGVPSPGFSDTKGVLAELLIKPLETGQISFRFDPDSQVLANDGLGTNVLRASIDSSYFVADLGGDSGETNRIFLFSYTHPNSETWYRNKKIDLFWRADWSEEYYYLFDNEPFSIPDEKNKTDKDFITFNPKNDGIYYFHLGGVKSGIMRSVYHYKIKIDSSPPDYLHLKVNNRVINKGEVVRTEFETMDKVSGVEPNLFYIKIDDSVYLPTKSPLYIPFNKAGNHTVFVKAYDRADNYLEDSLEIKVKSTPLVKSFINIFAR